MCTIGAIAAGSQATITITAAASGTGTLTPTAQLSTAGLDPIAPNNSAMATVTVGSAQNGGGGGGGSGAGGPLELLALAGLLLALRDRTGGRHSSPSLCFRAPMRARPHCMTIGTFGDHRSGQPMAGPPP